MTRALAADIWNPGNHNFGPDSSCAQDLFDGQTSQLTLRMWTDDYPKDGQTECIICCSVRK